MINEGLKLTDDDLLDVFCDTPTLQIQFNHFSVSAQIKIRKFGKGTFERVNGSGVKSFCVIYPPKTK